MSQQPEHVRLGISSCLLGEKVRFDGAHKRDRFLVEIFGKYVEWVPVCPEVEVGMPVPRDHLRLVDEGGEPRLVTPKTGEDWTGRMKRFAHRRSVELGREGISGFVFKRSSPSCGVARVRVYKNGIPGPSGTGLFAAEFMAVHPHLPVEEEGRLNDPRLRENFVSRIFAYRRWTRLNESRLSRRALMEFHAAHKFLLLAHNQQGMRRLGAMLGRAREYSSVRALADDYWEGFSEVMARTPSRRNHTNALQHISGYVSDALDGGDRAELAEAIEGYRLGWLPLIVPITLLRHYVRRLDLDYVKDQVYLNPHPDELMLLNQL